MSSTTLTSWALLVWNALQEAGKDARSIFTEVDLDPSSLGDGNARYKIDKMYQLWQAAVSQTCNPCFGVDAGKHWSPTTFHALGFAWLASGSLQDAFERMARYSRLVNDSMSASLKRSGTNYHFTVRSLESSELLHPAGIDASITAIVKMCRMLVGESFTPIEIHMHCPRAPSGVCLESYTQAPVIYNKTEYALIVDRHDAERLLPTANPELIRANEQIALHYLSMLERNNLTARVKSKIIELLPSGDISEEEVAKALNVSLRTLQRKLREESESYGHLLKVVKKDMAENYIQDSQLSISEIAYLLGFSDQANFTRAFRRWNGSTPSQYRQAIRNNISNTL